MDTNQNPELEVMAEEEGLFDEFADDELTETPEAVEETEAEETHVEEKPGKAETTTPFLKVKYNKEEKELTQEEAIKFAQMGMNYDNVLSKYNTLNSSVERLAKMNGMDVNTYLEQLESAQVEFETSRELEALTKQYPNSDEALLKEIATNRVNARRTEQGKIAQEEKHNEETQNQEIIKMQVEKFNKRYPNLDAGKLDDKVYDLMKEGYTLLEAYTIFKENAESEAKQKEEAKQQVASQNEANKRRGLGNINSTGNIEADDFMKGFDMF